MTSAKRQTLLVHRRPGSRTQGLLLFQGTAIPCVLGRGGIKTLKREGDGATPIGRFSLLHLFAPAARHKVAKQALSFSTVTDNMGWCDAPRDANYNRPVRLPHGTSHELLKRSDRLYQRCIVLDYNIYPRRRGAGSAIFFHLTSPEEKPTEGCIAIDPEAMRRLLPRLSRYAVMVVKI